VEREVSSYFEALFQGRHVPSANASGFVDSGSSFQLDLDLLPGLLDGLPSLSPDQQAKLELPFTLGELQSAVEAATPLSNIGGVDHVKNPVNATPLLNIGRVNHFKNPVNATL
jgi:hypothetical protein